MSDWKNQKRKGGLFAASKDYSELLGEKFGRLTVIGVGAIVPRRGRKLVCQCDCGTKKEILAESITSGNTKSCGCKKGCHKHGMSNTKMFHVWMNMKARCYNKNAGEYPNYGERGIKVCGRWLESFGNFYEDMGDGYKEGLSIDRIDVNGDYSKENCRWATQKTQNENKRDNVYLEINDEKKLIGEWASMFGFPTETIRYRVKAGWPIEKLFDEPKIKRPRKYTYELQ